MVRPLATKNLCDLRKGDNFSLLCPLFFTLNTYLINLGLYKSLKMSKQNLQHYFFSFSIYK
jgi:hypothetical protein